MSKRFYLLKTATNEKSVFEDPDWSHVIILHVAEDTTTEFVSAALNAADKREKECSV